MEAHLQVDCGNEESAPWSVFFVVSLFSGGVVPVGSRGGGATPATFGIFDPRSRRELI